MNTLASIPATAMQLAGHFQRDHGEPRRLCPSRNVKETRFDSFCI